MFLLGFDQFLYCFHFCKRLIFIPRTHKDLIHSLFPKPPMVTPKCFSIKVLNKRKFKLENQKLYAGFLFAPKRGFTFSITSAQTKCLRFTPEPGGTTPFFCC